MAQRLADPPRQVDVGRPHHDRVVPLLDSHDPVQRVLGLFLLFLMARQMQDLVLVAPYKVAGDRELAGRTVVIDPMTRLAGSSCAVRAAAPSASAPRGTRHHTAGRPWVPAASVLSCKRSWTPLVDHSVAPGLPGYLALVLHFILPAQCQAVAERSMADVPPRAVDVNQSSIPARVLQSGCRRRSHRRQPPDAGSTR